MAAKTLRRATEPTVDAALEDHSGRNAIPKHSKNGGSAQVFRDYLLAELRCASIRAQVLKSDIDAIGLALKGGLISPDQALVHLHEVDALRIVGVPAEAAA